MVHRCALHCAEHMFVVNGVLLFKAYTHHITTKRNANLVPWRYSLNEDHDDNIYGNT